jgi:hypothetical protein
MKTLLDLVPFIWAVCGLIGTSTFAYYSIRNPKASASIKHKGSELILNPSGEKPYLAEIATVELATEQPDAL